MALKNCNHNINLLLYSTVQIYDCLIDCVTGIIFIFIKFNGCQQIGTVHQEHLPIPVGECHHYIKRSQNQDEMVKWVAVNHLICLIINQLLPVSILHQVYVTCFVWFPQSCGLWSNIWCWCISGGPCWLDACVENNKKCQDNCYYGVVVNTPHCWWIVHKWIARFHCNDRKQRWAPTMTKSLMASGVERCIGRIILVTLPQWP